MQAFKLDQVFDTPFKEGGSSVADIIELVLKGSLAIAGIALLVIIIGAGIALITSAGGGKPDDTAKAAKTATSALIGFIIVFAAYLIVQLLGNFLTGNLEMITSPGQ